MNLTDLKPNQIVYMPVMIVSVDGEGEPGSFPVKILLPLMVTPPDTEYAWLAYSVVKLLREAP